MNEDRPPSESGEPTPRTSLAFGSVLYVVMLGLAFVWLWIRDREAEFGRLAIGEHGPWIASGVGLATGWLGAMALRWFGPFSKSLHEVERLTAELFRRVRDTEAVLFLLVAALAEEVFFRLAVQDAFGLVGSVAAYVLLNSSVGGLGVVPFTALHALAMGLLVQQGFGLLASTTAHAIMNYLSLRRILCT